MQRFHLLALLLLAACLWCCPAVRPLHAQDAAAERPAAAADPPAGEDEDVLAKKPAQTLGQIIFGSGPLALAFYVLLAIFSLVAMTITLERLVNLRRSKALPPRFARRLQELIARREDSVESLEKLCETYPSPAARVLHAGVLRAGRPLPEVEKGMEDAMSREMAAMRGRNRVLSVVGNVAPLVGLLGTVVGIMVAFRIASQQGTGKADVLAEGIYIALLTTAGGLMIAIPCVLLAAWFNARVDRYFREIDECLMDALPSFTRLEAQGPVAAIREPSAPKLRTAT